MFQLLTALQVVATVAGAALTGAPVAPAQVAPSAAVAAVASAPADADVRLEDVPVVVPPAADAAAPAPTTLPTTPPQEPAVDTDAPLVVDAAVAGDRVVAPPVATDVQTVALTWPEGTVVDGLDPQVRARVDGRWGAWTPLEVDGAAPDAGSADARREARAGSPSLWVGTADAVQLSVAAQDEGGPRGLELVLLSSDVETAGTASARTTPAPAPTAGAWAPAWTGLGAALPRAAAAVAATSRVLDAALPAAAPAGPVAAAATAPAVVSRAQWGAAPQACAPDVASRVAGVVVHHTAGPNGYASPAEAMAQIRNDQRYHIDARGWCDIGYNFLVDRWGNVYEGRANSMTQPVIGVHAGGFNTATVGISMLGDYSTLAPTPAMTDAVARVAAWRMAAYRVDPRSTVAFATAGGENSRYPAGSVAQLPAIWGHRDVAYTACPGNAGYAALGAIRAAAARYYDSWPEWNPAHSVSTQMRLLWDRHGGPSGPLGSPVEGQRCDLRPEGCSQQFSGARVFWSPRTGAEAVGGLILARYAGSGAQASVGYPTSTVFGCPSSGCTQRFESGVVMWSPSTGAHLVGGAIYARWQASGGLGTGIGYPVTTVLGCDAGAGCTQQFAAGRITYSGATGAHVIGGALLGYWLANGAEKGALGYPTSTQLGCDPGAGCLQTFAGGGVVWSAASGARGMTTPVTDVFRAVGAAAVGMPTTSVLTCTTAVCEHPFERGTAVWAPGRPAQMGGGIVLARWRALGGASSPLGLPTSTVLGCDPSAGCTQTFDGGAVGWTARTGAHAVPAQLVPAWRAAGAPAVGYPVETVVACAGSRPCLQQLEHATLAWSPATGAHAVGGVIRARWLAEGGATGRLGLPTSTVLACDWAAGCTQTFERGAIRWSGPTGAVVQP